VRKRWVRKRWVAWVGTIVVAVLLAATIAGGLVRLPYYSIGPGPAQSVEPLITFDGHPRYPSDGSFVLTTVSISAQPVTPVQALAAWIDPNASLLPSKDLIAPGVTPQHEQTIQLSSMDQSKVDATVVALRQLGIYPKQSAPGSLIEQVVPGCPADGTLSPGEVVTSVNGQDVGTPAQASKAILAIPTSKPVTLGLAGDGKTADVTLSRRTCAGSKTPVIGIVMIPNLPFNVSYASGDIGGPSAGLMWTLGLYDLLTPGDLAGGKVIAGTGVINPDGSVGAIGGVQDKVAAAKAAGAQVFLVPKANYADASKVAGNLKLVPVTNFEDALRALGG
jgi:PDZ domain-containing protein